MTDIDRLLADHLETRAGKQAPPVRTLIGRAQRRTMRRRAVAGSLGLLVAAGLGTAGLTWPDRAGTDSEQLVAAEAPSTAPAASAPPCNLRPETVVPDCPVTPVSPDPHGRPTALPPGYELVNERREAFPTGTSKRIDLLTRLYEGPGSAEILVDVYFGDVLPNNGQTFGRQLPSVRPGTVVHEVPEAVGGSVTASYTYQAAPRIYVAVNFRDSSISETERLAFIAGIS